MDATSINQPFIHHSKIFEGQYISQIMQLLYSGYVHGTRKVAGGVFVSHLRCPICLEFPACLAPFMDLLVKLFISSFMVGVQFVPGVNVHVCLQIRCPYFCT
jgi:hypothetical protein